MDISFVINQSKFTEKNSLIYLYIFLAVLKLNYCGSIRTKQHTIISKNKQNTSNYKLY